MAFDFSAAVSAPFRMQPGLRRLAAGSPQLTPLAGGSRHQREKLAVLSAYWPQALCAQPGFDAGPALDALCRHAQAEQPQAWAWDGHRAQALAQGVAVTHDGGIEQLAAGRFGLGDEVSRCLQGLPPPWRLAGLISLSFAEDFAVIDGHSGCVPWMAVALPSHWAPEAKVGCHFTAIHAPVPDGALLLKAADGLLRLVTGPDRWERHVWNVTGHNRLHAHPGRVDPQRWLHSPVERAWWRTERQTFIALPAARQAVFTIGIEVQPLRLALRSAADARAVHAALASMSPAVIDYRGLHAVRDELLAWLDQQATAP
jgi:hypothetical protein